MTKNFHISPDSGEARPCSATVKECPFGENMPHFENKQQAQAYFESIMEPKPKKKKDEVKLLRDLEFDNMDTIIAINDSGKEISFGGQDIEYFDKVASAEVSRGNSKEIADFVSAFSQPMDDDEEEYFIPLDTVSYSPIGKELDDHSANVFQHKGKDYVVDFAYSEVNPNADYPYIDTLDNWKKDLDRVSFMGVEEKIVPPPDPRTFELAKVQPGEYNPLVEKAVLEEPIRANHGVVSFLKVDEVKVAVAHYRVEDDGPHLMTIETRPEYRQQGYMKKLLKELAVAHNVEKVHSSGSFTQQGFDYTRHLTNPSTEVKPAVNFAEYNDDTPLKYVEDWVEGHFPR